MRTFQELLATTKECLGPVEDARKHADELRKYDVALGTMHDRLADQAEHILAYIKGREG